MMKRDYDFPVFYCVMLWLDGIVPLLILLLIKKTVKICHCHSTAFNNEFVPFVMLKTDQHFTSIAYSGSSYDFFTFVFLFFFLMIPGKSQHTLMENV